MADVVVNLSGPVTVTTQPAVTAETAALTVERVVDLPQLGEVRAFIKELGRPVVVWSGSDYDAEMSWTKTTLSARLTALAASGFTFA